MSSGGHRCGSTGALRDGAGAHAARVPLLPARAGRSVLVRWAALLVDVWCADPIGRPTVRGTCDRMVTGSAAATVERRPPRGIEFPPLVDQWGHLRPNPFFAASQFVFEDAARRTRWPLPPRMFALALARMDRHGHAQFAPGELHESLAKLNRETGELVDVHRTAIPTALRSLINDELICADSTPRCVRFSPATAQMNYGKSSVCRVHR